MVQYVCNQCEMGYFHSFGLFLATHDLLPDVSARIWHNYIDYWKLWKARGTRCHTTWTTMNHKIKTHAIQKTRWVTVTHCQVVVCTACACMRCRVIRSPTTKTCVTYLSNQIKRCDDLLPKLSDHQYFKFVLYLLRRSFVDCINTIQYNTIQFYRFKAPQFASSEAARQRCRLEKTGV